MVLGSATAKIGLDSQSESHTRLRGHWLASLRGLWLAVAVLTLGLFVAGIPSRFDRLLGIAAEYRPALQDLGLSADFYAAYLTALDIAIVLTHFVLAALIFWRKSDDWMALFVSLTLVTAPLSFIKALEGVQPAWRLLADFVNYLGLVSSISLLYLFPDGRFVPRWTRPLAVLWAGLNLPAIFFPAAPLSLRAWPLALQVLLLLGWSGSGVYAQIHRYLGVSSSAQRQQIKWAVLGLTAAVLGPIGYYLPFFTLPSLTRPSLPGLFYSLAGPTVFTLSLLYRLASVTVFTLGLLLFPISFAVAILRYRLWDINLLINRTLVYAALTGTLALVYFASVVLLQSIFRPLALPLQPEIVTAVSTLAIAALFFPLRRRVQAGIDRRFYRRKYDAAQTLAAFSATLRDEVDLNKLINRLLEVVEETMQPAYLTLSLRKQLAGSERGAFVHHARVPRAQNPSGEIAGNDPLIAYLQAAPGAVEMEGLELDSPALHDLKAAGVRLVVPLVSQAELIGVLNLWPRLGQQGYSTDDRRLLSQMAPQAAAAMRVVQLTHIEQEMRVARQIQQSLLPDKLPALPGWRVAAHYQPARAVGGDFYDFLYLPDGRLGLVVGDVADKGMPAALVMATTRSILRGAGQQYSSAGQVLERVNELLCPDMLPKMFVTCLYAILDPASGRLQYANAGHDLPYRHSRTKVDELRATGMPLGLMPGMKYEEKEIILSPGEGVLFYSDGLVEAHNPRREMLGFPRLRELVGNAQREGAAMIDFLLAGLEDHVGDDWEQEDDVTLVILERADEILC